MPLIEECRDDDLSLSEAAIRVSNESGVAITADEVEFACHIDNRLKYEGIKLQRPYRVPAQIQDFGLWDSFKLWLYKRLA